MQTVVNPVVVNPVKVVSDFLKSEEAKGIMAALAEPDRQVPIGAADGVKIVLEKDGFKAVRKSGATEPATAYDVFDCFTARKTKERRKCKLSTIFLRFVKECAVSRPVA